jgi:hypothetical protein
VRFRKIKRLRLRIARFRGLLEAVRVKAKPRSRPKISGHEDDSRIYECAAAGKANYLVTENTNTSNTITRPPQEFHRPPGIGW